MGSLRRVRILPREELEKLTTERLQAYRKRLYSVCEQRNWDNLAENRPSYEVTKDMPSFKAAIADVKAVMASREHLER